MHQTAHPAARSNIRLELASRPEDVVLARELLSGVAAAASIGPEGIEDIRTAVSEACNNVVQHAYDGAPGPIELDLALQDDALQVTVRDRGGGMHPWIRTPKSDTLGIGLLVIKALAESVELGDVPEGGMEVQMRFSTPGLAALDPGGPAPPARAPFDPSGLAISVAIAPSALAGNILPRLLSAMAVRAHFSTDRISDLQIVADAIVAHCEPAIDGAHLCVRIAAALRSISLSLSPLLPAGAAQLLADASIEGLGSVIEQLSDECEVRCEDGTETLVLRLRDQR
jgi:serine/threonine-protein kinase RsbW